MVPYTSLPINSHETLFYGMIVNVPQFDPIKDTKFQFYLTYIFFLKASIIGRKKEAAAEKLQEAMDEVG